jgi:hypothetical protein
LTTTFAARSDRPGDRAELVLWSRERDVRVQLFRAGLEHPGRRARGSNELRGEPVTEPRRVAWRRARTGARIRIGIAWWPSGLYFARVIAGRRVGYAPFILRPERLGESRVAVVLPTTRGRRTTSATSIGTASATRGTPTPASTSCGSTGRF